VVACFIMMALAFLLIGLVPGATTTVAPFVILFGASYFFTEFGPNMTTFVYPAEIFPVEVRTTGHGISAAAGKLGAGQSETGDVVTHRIVVCVDGSEHGNAALSWAVDEATIHEGEIVAVFAWQMPFVGIPGAFDRDEMENICKVFLADAVAAAVPEARVPITQLVAEGDVSASLIAAAEKADMLVLGSRGRGGFAGLKLGSVSRECAQHAACAVVIIKRI
jgi:nucleotide-binding universal stress UspA family protein